MNSDAAITAALEHHRAGRLLEAERLYQGVLAADPLHADALHLSALIALVRGEGARALALVEGALAQRETAVFRFSAGLSLSLVGRHDDAAACFGRALSMGLEGADTHAKLGAEYVALRRWLDAEAACRRAIAADPRHAEAWGCLGAALLQQGRMEESAAACMESLAIEADGGPALYHLGSALRALGRLEESEAALRRLVTLGHDGAAGLNNLSMTLEALGRYDVALSLLDRALGLEAGNPVLRHNRGRLLLRAGRLVEGWEDYEARVASDPDDADYRRFSGRDAWRGEPLDGRTILLVPEQGLGDTIMFARFAALVAGRGGRVVMGVQGPLRRLFETLPGVDAFVGMEEAGRSGDLYAYLMSLPRVLGTTLQTIPAAIPYLRAVPALRSCWEARIGVGRPGLRVGVVWAGNPHHSGDRQRSIPFGMLAPLLAVPGVRWFSLQVGERAVDGGRHPGVEELGAGLTDFAETAAAVSTLELVIAVDTSTAHLAGALGQRTWLLLPYAADWRWMTMRDSSPWYPTMRLFRQDGRRLWGPVLERVAAELARLIAGR